MKMKNKNIETDKNLLNSADKLNEAEVEAKSEDRTSPVLALLIAIQESGAELFHDQYHDTYIAYYGDGSSVAKISSKVTKLWLIRYAYTNLKAIPSTDTINRVLQSLSARAHFEGRQHSLDVRSVHNSDGLWYDLGERAVLITDTGWKVPYDVPLAFKRFPHQKKQATPVSGGSLQLLLKYVNVKNESDQLLFLVYLVAAFIPNFPHPLLILHGAQGAGKTTPMKLMKELIDPSELGGLSAPKNIESFVQTISHHSFMFYDNLSKMPEWLSDALARAATGDSFSKRELYTDDDDVIYRFQKTIALNGINQVVYKSDLLDRSILLNLERISPENRKESQVFWAEFELDRPLILGAIFDTLAKTLAIYPTVKMDRLPRMADFARWGYAIAEASGYSGKKFIEAYNSNIIIQHDEAIEANPVAQTIIEFMSDRDAWEGTPAELYNLLNVIAFKLQISQSRGWPKDAARLGRALTSIAPNLIAKDIELERSRSKDRLITISKSTVTTDETDAPSSSRTNVSDSTSVSSVIDK
jgi:hypothetical protein